MRLIRPPSLIKPPLGTQINPSHPLAQGLVGCWLFNEGGGLTTYDTSGNNNKATLTSAPAWNSGQFGSSLKFNGTSDYLNIPASNNLGFTGAFTVAAWTYYTQATDDGSDRIIFCRGTGGNDDIEVYQDSGVAAQGLTVSFNRGNGGNASFIANNSHGGTAAGNGSWGSVARSAWNHLAVTFDSSQNASVYVNGVLKGTGNMGTNPINTSGGVWQIGTTTDSAAFGSTRFWKGSLDVPLIYNRALSAAEVQQLYAQPFAFMRPRRLVMPVGAGAAPPPASGFVYIGNYF